MHRLITPALHMLVPICASKLRLQLSESYVTPYGLENGALTNRVHVLAATHNLPLISKLRLLIEPYGTLHNIHICAWLPVMGDVQRSDTEPDCIFSP
jgi:hypothetical protein